MARRLTSWYVSIHLVHQLIQSQATIPWIRITDAPLLAGCFRMPLVSNRRRHRIECCIYRNLYRVALGHKARTLLVCVVAEPKVLLLGRRIGR